MAISTLLPIAVQLLLFLLLRNNATFNFFRDVTDSMVNTVLVFIIASLALNAISILLNKGHLMIFLPVVLIFISLICRLLLLRTGDIEGVGALGYGLFFEGVALWTLFYGISTIPSSVVLFFRNKHIKKRSA